jgi:hypothetical protein
METDSKSVVDLILTPPPPEYHLFRTRAPKDLIDGAVNCITNVCITTFGSITLITASPLIGLSIGAEDNGFWGALSGFGIGLGVGIIGGIGVIITGN